ncbi:GNAT family N-acetyltransferase [Amycolatopsis tolypomycina]|uniref:GNAT family N-acetyltransferase n=1 Tax=Amycolatopsis tolypomycina TaxID=208445 RepID=UPI0033B660C5
MTDEQWSRVHDRYRAAARRVAAGEGTGLLTDAKEAAELGPALYHDVDGVPARAVEASLGCGNPLAVVDIRPGDVVLDLGSGGGLDVLLSAKRAGPAGRAIGIDMTDEMLQLAREHAAKAGVSNVEFRKGRIEDVPLPEASVDVVISNCVIALSPDKAAVFGEIARVLKPGGRVGIADVVVEEGAVASPCDEDCLAGAVTEARYAELLELAGLGDVSVTPSAGMEGGRRAVIVRARKPVAVRIVPMETRHAESVLRIYQDGLDTGDASFQTEAPSWDAWDEAHLAEHRLVAEDVDGRVVGWVAVTRVSSRPVYAGVVEHSVYVAADARGRGVGPALLRALVASTEAAGVWMIQSGIFPENKASLVAHERAGFRVLGTRERIGRHGDRWRDVVFIERRSAVAGLD